MTIKVGIVYFCVLLLLPITQASIIPVTASQFSGTPTIYDGILGGTPVPYGYANNTNDQGWILWNVGDHFIVNFNTATAFNKFRIWSVYTGSIRGSKWEVLGSTNGTTFTSIATFNYVTSMGGGVNDNGTTRSDYAGWYEFNFNASAIAYQYWKIVNVQTLYSHSARSAEVQFYAADNVPEPMSVFLLSLGFLGYSIILRQNRKKEKGED